MEKTAIEWLVEQINSDCLNSTFVRNELIEQAIAMEKEQIIEAHLDGQTTWDVTSKTADKYYNETFKSE